MSPGSIALLVAGVSCLVMLLSSAVSYETSSRTVVAALKIEPAMEFRNVHLVNQRIRSGDPLILSYTYDKREDCFPDKGEGELNFKFFKGSTIDGWRPGLRSDEPPGVNLKAVNEIATPALGEGAYELGLRAVFVCAGERATQLISIPPLKFEVIP